MNYISSILYLDDDDQIRSVLRIFYDKLCDKEFNYCDNLIFEFIGYYSKLDVSVYLSLLTITFSNKQYLPNRKILFDEYKTYLEQNNPDEITDYLERLE